MEFSQLSDDQIAQKFRETVQDDGGRKSVLQALYEELYHRFYSKSFYMSRYYGLSRTDAEDSVQEAFINLYRSIRTYQPDRPFKPWFFRIVMNEIRKKYNELKRKRYQDLDNYQDIPEGDGTGGGKNIFENIQFRVVLRDITHELPERLRQVLLLKVYSDMSLKQIALAVGISPRQVINRLNRAYHLIRGRLGDRI